MLRLCLVIYFSIFSVEKVTIMVLKVDLDCCQCYRKVKRTLCKFPQIRDQVYDEKQNTVTITVVCCSPEKIKDKLRCKGGKSIKAIEIKQSKKPEPEKPKPKSEDKPKPDQPKPAPPAADPEKPKPKPAPEAQPPAPAPEKVQKNGSKKESAPASEPKPKPAAEPAPAPAPAPKMANPFTFTAAMPEAQWVPGYPPPQVYPVSVCYGPCCGGVAGGPCYQGHGPSYGYSTYGRPPCPPGYYSNRSDYFTEENPAACSVM